MRSHLSHVTTPPTANTPSVRCSLHVVQKLYFAIFAMFLAHVRRYPHPGSTIPKLCSPEFIDDRQAGFGWEWETQNEPPLPSVA